jgi:DNA replication and repair protein RecF
MNFPKIQIFLTGKIEKFLVSQDIDSVKKIYLQKLHKSRKIDSIKRSISYGPNKSDLKVIFLKKRLLAEKCSTGEQKIILISLIVQFCKLMNNKKNFPILLLDEIVAHLDNKIRSSLFEELKTLKNQVWMSGTGISLFSSIIKDKKVVNLEIEDLLKQ